MHIRKTFYGSGLSSCKEALVHFSLFFNGYPIFFELLKSVLWWIASCWTTIDATSFSFMDQPPPDQFPHADLFDESKKRPTVATDVALFTVMKGKLFTLLIKRGHDPYKGMMAFPGGFMEWGESCDQSAVRELWEETAVRNVSLELLGVFSRPGRDPRGTIISVAYIAVVDGEKISPKAGDDAAEASWVEVNQCPHLAADHDEMLQASLQHPLIQELLSKKSLA